jgi:hypothetical protein
VAAIATELAVLTGLAVLRVAGLLVETGIRLLAVGALRLWETAGLRHSVRVGRRAVGLPWLGRIRHSWILPCHTVPRPRFRGAEDESRQTRQQSERLRQEPGNGRNMNVMVAVPIKCAAATLVPRNVIVISQRKKAEV